MMPSIPSSLTEKAEGGPDHAVIPWRVGLVRAGICTLGWTPLAGGQEPAQGQDQLMQRGPIVAGPAEGMQLCWPLPRGSSGESRGRLSGQAGAVCSGSALTQEGNTPFMETPRALGSLPVPEVGEGPDSEPVSGFHPTSNECQIAGASWLISISPGVPILSPVDGSRPQDDGNQHKVFFCL